jgi:hypothetical protein
VPRMNLGTAAGASAPANGAPAAGGKGMTAGPWRRLPLAAGRSNLDGVAGDISRGVSEFVTRNVSVLVSYQVGISPYNVAHGKSFPGD